MSVVYQDQLELEHLRTKLAVSFNTEAKLYYIDAIARLEGKMRMAEFFDKTSKQKTGNGWIMANSRGGRYA